eukprot:6715863-Prymnesium_polylepis.1
MSSADLPTDRPDAEDRPERILTKDLEEYAKEIEAEVLTRDGGGQGLRSRVPTSELELFEIEMEFTGAAVQTAKGTEAGTVTSEEAT